MTWFILSIFLAALAASVAGLFAWIIAIRRQYKGHRIHITGGDNAGESRGIKKATSSVIVPDARFSSVPSLGATISLERPQKEQPCDSKS